MAKAATQKPDYDLVHPLYARLKEIRTTSRDLYNGSVAIKADKVKARRYLFQTPNETDKAYEFRLKRAVYDNWSSMVVGSRLALTWRKSPERKAFPAELETYLKDIDAAGTHADTFFKGVNEAASVDGLAWVLVDKTRVPVLTLGDGTRGATDANGTWWSYPFSVAAEAALKIRTFMKLITAQAVYDWKVGQDGKLEWLVLATTRQERTEPGYPIKEIEQRTIWFKDRWVLLEKSDGQDGKTVGEWVEVAVGENPLGEIPIVPFYGIKEEDYLGWPVTKDIHDHCISIFNKFSDRDVSEFMTNNAIPYVIGAEKPDKIDATHGQGIFLKAVQGLQAEIGYLQTTGNGVTASRDSERDLIRRIVEIALRQAKRDTAQVQSDDSLKEEAHIFSSSLVSVAVSMEAGENKCWELFTRWNSPKPTAQEWTGEVVYNRDFDDGAIGFQMITALSGMVDKGQLPVEVLLDILKNGEVIPENLDIKDLLRKIEEDLNRKTMPGFGQKPGNVPPASGQGQPPPASGGAPGQGGPGHPPGTTAAQ